MKITYISHAALLIETNGVKILTDPWFFGSTYCNQWHLFPQNKNYKDKITDIDVVLISHGHEDHMQLDSLKEINKNAAIYYPYSWFNGAVEFFNSLGFKNVIEAKNEKKYNLAKNTSVTYLANNLDNILVIESNGKVLLDVNDALPCAPVKLIDFFIDKINKKWTNIDYFFSSYGGASYFPNTVKCSWKNDIEIGQIREQYFLDSFCKMAEAFKAKFTIPNASDFVLLDDNQRWMNDVRFPREKIKNYFNKFYKKNSTQIVEMYPNDEIENNLFVVKSDHHEKIKSTNLNKLIDETFDEEIKEKRNERNISQLEFEHIIEKIKNQVKLKQHIIPADVKIGLKFVINITDYNQNKYLEIDFNSTGFNSRLITQIDKSHLLVIKLKSKTILYSIDNEWGGDAIIIGYGCEIEVFDKETISKEIDNYIIQILTNYPNAKEYIKKNPIRAIKYLASDKIKRRMFLNRLKNKKSGALITDNEILGDNSLWLTRTKCEICKKCNLPIITDENADYLI